MPKRIVESRVGLLIRLYDEKIKNANSIDELISVVYPPHLNVDIKREKIRILFEEGGKSEKIMELIIPKKWLRTEYDYILLYIRKEIELKLQGYL